MSTYAREVLVRLMLLEELLAAAHGEAGIDHLLESLRGLDESMLSRLERDLSAVQKALEHGASG